MADYPTNPESQSESLAALCSTLSEKANQLRSNEDWPEEQLKLCGEAGIYRWFMEPTWGGWDWDEKAVTEGYLALSASCLTTTFVITQRTGACRRIASSDNDWIKDTLLPDLTSGDSFATVGISHLTTSRRHLKRPVLRATRQTGGFLLDGFSPWVTGAPFADHVVLGATLEDGTEILTAVPTDLPGVECPPTPELVGLSASRTGEVRCNEVFVEDRYLLEGPCENVMQQGAGASTGGLQTSTLAVGLADAAIGFVEQEATKRDNLSTPVDAMRDEWRRVRQLLLDLASGNETGTRQQLRASANSLAVRSTQSALTAAKGSGYVVGHPAGRWCQEALFFLVWSCPQEVLSANLCEFAGIADD